MKLNKMNTMKIKIFKHSFPTKSKILWTRKTTKVFLGFKKKRKMNKKAFIRIVEAMIAILMILTAVLIIVSNQIKNIDISEDVYEKQRHILDVIASNEDMRSEIINGQGTLGVGTLTYDFILKNIPNSWDFVINICGVDEICNQGTSPENDRDIYVSEVIISASLTNFPDLESTKLRFFVWRK